MHAQHITSRESALKVARKMPLLDHFHRGRPFDIMESDVCAWLCKQPEIRQELVNWVKAIKRSSSSMVVGSARRPCRDSARIEIE
jgi:hypothetical protein